MRHLRAQTTFRSVPGSCWLVHWLQGPGIPATRTQIYLPDASGVMAAAGSLQFNDAPWLAESSGLRLVHPDVPAGVAEQLGARSLLYQHQVRSVFFAGIFEQLNAYFLELLSAASSLAR